MRRLLRNTVRNSCRGVAVSKTLALFLLIGFAIPSKAQVVVAPSEVEAVKQTFDSQEQANSLNCFIESWGPSLDFEFRYQAGYQAAVNMKQLRPGEEITSYLRVTPLGEKPVFLEHFISIPVMPAEQARTFQSRNYRRFQLTGSGRFSLGEGKYSVELLLIDEQGQSCYQRWKVQTAKYPGHSVPLALPPRTVSPVRPAAWDGKLESKGVRLSVLLDAAPVSPFAARLHASDRAFSLEALAALLKELPCQSVQIVAFNLDQQRDVFREGNFDADGFGRLAVALQTLELSSVPVEALKRGNNVEYLRKLAREQANSGQFDAVVFVGPNQQAVYDNPQAQNMELNSTRFFYLEGYGSASVAVGPPPVGIGRFGPMYQQTPFPDSIEYLTKELHGSVFHITSAKDLAMAIPKMLAQLRPAQSSEAPAPGH